MIKLKYITENDLNFNNGKIYIKDIGMPNILLAEYFIDYFMSDLKYRKYIEYYVIYKIPKKRLSITIELLSTIQINFCISNINKVFISITINEDFEKKFDIKDFNNLEKLLDLNYLLTLEDLWNTNIMN